ncbi:hypothetical protein OG252_12945 [Streptomyces sp. NBC_01352]|uniref:hypothetical protein n=1 Tax=Streptomyces sp. NBC_01352 TaxID=2903834 RepID=UPI002E2EEC3B|nr:hypothetical protein [Streptomyces sp. NBC_01352]
MSGSRVDGSSNLKVLALLPLPDLNTRTDDQTRGATCVYDGVPLAPTAAVNLGERMSPLNGSTSLMRWFPRACPGCVQKAATAAVREHAGNCEQCVDDASRCDTRIRLEQLAREGRR